MKWVHAFCLLVLLLSAASLHLSYGRNMGINDSKEPNEDVRVTKVGERALTSPLLWWNGRMIFAPLTLVTALASAIAEGRRCAPLHCSLSLFLQLVIQ
ncbi:hypothetical protein AMTRI_Chr04g185960 [Amborella trichopoda]